MHTEQACVELALASGKQYYLRVTTKNHTEHKRTKKAKSAQCKSTGVTQPVDTEGIFLIAEGVELPMLAIRLKNTFTLERQQRQPWKHYPVINRVHLFTQPRTSHCHSLLASGQLIHSFTKQQKQFISWLLELKASAAPIVCAAAHSCIP